MSFVSLMKYSIGLGVALATAGLLTSAIEAPDRSSLYWQQLSHPEETHLLRARLLDDHQRRATQEQYRGIAFCIAILAVVIGRRRHVWLGMIALVSLSMTGCWRPFEPVKLETIQPNEEAFLLPFTDSIENQSSSRTEDYLRRNLVYTQQVKIPQQWVPKGYEILFPNGVWQDAAILVRVNKSPVTREWTADANSGTSTRNEAIWVMTSDQVEFSTGWTCTARISSRDDAVRFLHNYPNGALTQVMDQEVRAKLQSEFGIEVTDLPMDELRKKATPHIRRVTEDVIAFFQERGITITNLGITGGFVYKDPSIIKTMVEVFNAEQKKSIAIAETSAQAEKNKTIKLESDARADALLTEKKAEAEGIRLVADAKNYEIEMAIQDPETYLRLKQFELERDKLQKWDGKFPTYFLGNGSQSLDLLLQPPAVTSR